MKASVVDLRYKMNDILKALDRNETVSVLYHGKMKGVIIPDTALILVSWQDERGHYTCQSQGNKKNQRSSFFWHVSKRYSKTCVRGTR